LQGGLRGRLAEMFLARSQLYRVAGGCSRDKSGFYWKASDTRKIVEKQILHYVQDDKTIWGLCRHQGFEQATEIPRVSLGHLPETAQ
jgi:hypothetical protein